ARGAGRRLRGNRRRTLGGVLRSGLARPAARDHGPDRGSSGPRRPPRRRESQGESVTYQLITNCYLSSELFNERFLAAIQGPRDAGMQVVAPRDEASAS